MHLNHNITLAPAMHTTFASYCIHINVKIIFLSHPMCQFSLSRVIHGIQNSDLKSLFNPENTFISKDGGGAGNNWASGFTQGEGVQETLLDMIGKGQRRITKRGSRDGSESEDLEAVISSSVGWSLRTTMLLAPCQSHLNLLYSQIARPSIATAWKDSHFATLLLEARVQAWDPSCWSCSVTGV